MTTRTIPQISEYQKTMILQLKTLAPSIFDRAKIVLLGTDGIKLHFKRADTVINIDWRYKPVPDLYYLTAYLFPTTALVAKFDVMDNSLFDQFTAMLNKPKTIEYSDIYFDQIPELIGRLIVDEAKQYQKDIDAKFINIKVV